MISNLPKIIHNNPPANTSHKSKLNKSDNTHNYKIIKIALAIILTVAVLFVGYQTFIYDNPTYVNVSKILPEHNWHIKLKTSSPEINQRLNMVANEQSWHFSKYGDVIVNNQMNAYNYLTSKHDLKLRNSNNPQINNGNYLKFRLINIHHNKQYTFKSIKTDAIPKSDQRTVRLILIKN